MCGRFAITLPPEAMRRLFAYEEMPNFPPRFNIAPTQPVPIVRAGRHEGRTTRHFQLARWGFLPGFVKQPKDFPLVFNARSEGLEQKASFRNAFRRRRCLVPADAFYEWRRTGTGKALQTTPFLCARADGQTMGLVGLAETWTGPNGEEVDTVCIVTTGANGISAAIHPRLPVVIEPDAFATWLDPDEETGDAAARLMRPLDDRILTFTPIGPAVNKVANNGPEVQTPIGPPLDNTPREESEEPTQGSLF